MATHCCPKMTIFQVFVDSSIEGAKHPKQAALAWNALLLPAAAVVKKYTWAFFHTPDRREAGFTEQ